MALIAATGRDCAAGPARQQGRRHPRTSGARARPVEEQEARLGRTLEKAEVEALLHRFGQPAVASPALRRVALTRSGSVPLLVGGVKIMLAVLGLGSIW